MRVRHGVDLSMESWGGGLEEALILLYLLVDDGYRAVTFGGRLRQRGLVLQLSFSFPSWSAVAISHREGLIVAI